MLHAFGQPYSSQPGTIAEFIMYWVTPSYVIWNIFNHICKVMPEYDVLDKLIIQRNNGSYLTI